MKKLLSLVIVLAMVIAMVPMGASAEEFTLEDFATFAELKELVARDDYEILVATYVGTEPLVIEENLPLSHNMQVISYDAPVVIPEGVTLTTGLFFGVADLTVNGTFVNQTHTYINGSLTVNGELMNYGTLSLMGGVAVTGADKITNLHGGRMEWQHTVNDMTQLRDTLSAAASDPEAFYQINYYPLEEPVVLDSDLEVPVNAYLGLYVGSFTVASGTTLTVNGNLFVADTMTVEGTLANNGYVDIWHIEGAILEMNGTYEGTGYIFIQWDNEFLDPLDPQTAIPGLDISLFPYVYEESYGWLLTHVDINGGGSGGSSDMEFSTFAELKEIIANAGSEWAYAVYQGSEPLVIEEDITIPENLMVQSYAVPVIVPEGVTVTAVGQFGAIELTVNGTYVNRNYLYISNSLTVNGTLTNSGLINLNSTASVTGRDKIVGGSFQWDYYISGSMEELAAALDAAAADLGTYYYITIEGSYDSVSVIELGANLTVPANTTLNMRSAEYTLPAGCTLRVLGTLLLEGNGKLSVLGTLSNEGNVNVGYPNGGLLNVEQGTYEGTGELYIYSWGETFEMEAAVPGLDLSQFPYVYEEDWGWLLTYVDQSGGSGSNYVEITSFEELVAAMEGVGADTYFEVVYHGSEPLTIESSITIPANIALYVPDETEIVVPQGVTLTNNGYIDAMGMTVNGKFVNNWYVGLYQALTVNGELVNGYVLSLQSYTNLTGADNIEYALMEDGRPAQLHWNWYATTQSELQEAIDVANANADNPSYWYALILVNETELVLTEDITVPCQARLAPAVGPVTVAEGATLTLEGGMIIQQSPVIVAGNLVSNKEIVVYNMYGATLEIVESGSYSGKGEIWVYVENADVDLSAAVPGIDVTNASFVATQGGYLIPPAEEAHTHEWGEGVVTTPAACTAEGVLTYTCACGETKTEAIPATGHSFGEWVTVLEPTTTTEGKAERKCACGETETKVLPILYTVPDVETSVSDSEFVEKLENAEDKAYIVAEVTGETTLPETAFEAISGTEKLLELVSEDVTWQFHGNDIVNEAKEIDLSVEIAKAEDSAQEIEEKLSENPGVVMKFAENGVLPGKATIQVKLDEELQAYLGESDKLCVYYYNEETDELELIAENVAVIDGSYVEFAITHCSYYVLTTEIEAEEEQLPKLGDVNNDGRLNAKDATLILRYSVKKYTDYPTWFEQIADVNVDGRVNAKDATLILRYVVSKAEIPGWEK